MVSMSRSINCRFSTCGSSRNTVTSELANLMRFCDGDTKKVNNELVISDRFPLVRRLIITAISPKGRDRNRDTPHNSLEFDYKGYSQAQCVVI
ncbi:hypothetical protein ES703_80800 [subsurface metagenome]